MPHHDLDQRLAWVRSVPDGVLFERVIGALHIVVIKRSDQIGLLFVNPSGTLDGPMSRIDLTRPLHLPAEYAQALTLSLLWRPEPQRVCMLGFGGGRLPLIFHHHLPHVIIESIDIDSVFVEIAERFFGVEIDERQRVVIGDGRAFLTQDGPRYDIIVMDAFGDNDNHLDHLGTVEFYTCCQQRLLQGGVLCVNMLRTDPHFGQKIAAFCHEFAHVSALPLKYSLILYGSTQRHHTAAQIAKRAAELQARLGLDFPFAERATDLRPFRLADLGFSDAKPLRDSDLTP
ncbi:MAG: fused MFS/spermidine synthase [Roseiflexaceae bacterium]|nr:fused MFS/spermidine synthase [Roseiflexaceae bacterium]